MVDQGSGTCNTLLLTTGELRRFAARELGHLHQLKGLIGQLQCVLLFTPLGPEGHIFPDRQVREERVGLEDGVDRALVGTRSGEIGVTDEHPAGCGLLQASDHPKGRGLATA